MRSRVLVLGSKEAEEEEAKEAEKNLEIAFRLLNTDGHTEMEWGILEGSPGDNPSGGSPRG